MFPRSYLTTCLAICLALFCANSHATSEWDRYDIEIGGQYRLYGDHGQSFVNVLESHGNLDSAPLFDGARNGVRGPVEYQLTDTHLFLRYRAVTDPQPADSTLPKYFTIRRSDNLVSGPLALTDLPRGDDGKHVVRSKWKSPPEPSEWPLRLIIVLLIIVQSPYSLPALAALLAIVVWVSWRKQVRQQAQGRVGESDAAT